jgi:hypothetical protein
MTPDKDQLARAERARLHWMSDAEVETTVAIARQFMNVVSDDKFVGLVQVAMVSTKDGLRDELVAPAARAVLYLARHGIPHGLSSSD